ncbi:hypothetical protein [Microbacterium sp. NIBRBAC000506063]|uniref:hypothetical protein n=1 Tax=Microbacterium sp. NIBRBAC000506063 TaxID=2734618 RepID=UPI001CB715AA|nr:hypothetical protein [Microbacterium sp. NIBRBAC000506063]
MGAVIRVDLCLEAVALGEQLAVAGARSVMIASTPLQKASASDPDSASSTNARRGAATWSDPRCSRVISESAEAAFGVMSCSFVAV